MCRSHLMAAGLFALLLLPMRGMAAAKTLSVTHKGAGPVNKDTPIGNSAALHRMFRGCRVETTTRILDHKATEKVVDVTCHGKPAWTLRTGRDLHAIASAEVHQLNASSPEGIRVGMSMADVYKLGQVDCDADVNPNIVRCVFLGDTAVAYSATDTTKDADGNLPSDEQIKRLKITGIIWRANMM